MLSQAHRLKNEKDIESLFRKGKGVFDAICGIKFRPNQVGASRFAIMIGKKVSKKAVVRNKIRRQYRAIIRKHLAEIAPGMDILLLVSPKGKDTAFKDREEQLMMVFKKARLL